MKTCALPHAHIFLIACVAVTSSIARADDPVADHGANHVGNDMRWADTLAPARAGVVDLGIGGGAAYTPLASPLGTIVTPGVVLKARWGISDNVELAFPLLFTLSNDLPLDTGALALRPRLSITAGIAGAGYVSDLGVLVTPAIAASASLVGKRIGLVVTVDGTATAAGSLHTIDDSVGASAGFVYAIDRRWSVGFSGLVAASQAQSVAPLAPRRSQSWTIGAGSAGGSVPADVPTVRFLVADPLSIELWTFADFRSVDGNAGLSAFGANVSATWHIDFLH